MHIRKRTLLVVVALIPVYLRAAGFPLIPDPVDSEQDGLKAEVVDHQTAGMGPHTNRIAFSSLSTLPMTGSRKGSGVSVLVGYEYLSIKGDAGEATGNDDVFGSGNTYLHLAWPWHAADHLTIGFMMYFAERFTVTNANVKIDEGVDAIRKADAIGINIAPKLFVPSRRDPSSSTRAYLKADIGGYLEREGEEEFRWESDLVAGFEFAPGEGAGPVTASWEVGYGVFDRYASEKRALTRLGLLYKFPKDLDGYLLLEAEMSGFDRDDTEARVNIAWCRDFGAWVDSAIGVFKKKEEKK
jgi:hypothetical protein